MYENARRQLSLQADFGNILRFMVNLDMNKLKGHKSFDSYLDELYGEENSVEPKEFEAKAKAWYYAELLKDERKRQNITQKALAEQIGKKREYISAIEKGFVKLIK